jgi:Domain of unknown function (DUF222)
MFDTDTPFDLYQPGIAQPESIPAALVTDLVWLPAGVMLAVALSQVDRERLSGFDRVSLLKARARQIAHDQAELLADIQSISEGVGDLVNHPEPDDRATFDTTASELSAALSLTRRASEMQTALAFDLCIRLPSVWKALSEGVIDLARARVLADQTCHIPRELAQRVCETALEKAPTQTTGQLRALIQKLIFSTDPAAAKDRYEQRLGERRVICEPTEDGTANLCGFDLPADDANRAMRRINRLAHTAKRNGDGRRIDQIRADVYLQLLTGNEEDKVSDRGVVDIRADLSTLLGFDDNPGEIPGWGPVIADVLRQIIDESHDGDWRFGIYDQGQLLGVIPTRRRPTAAQKRYVETRDPECVFPTCRFDSIQCDIDHQYPWAQHHRTIIEELEPLCRYHHQQKHGNWKLTRNTAGGYAWTSPLGHTYTTGPDPP